jgi:predicted transcriptional regulator
MATRAVKKTISLPSELTRELEEQARAEQKTLSGVIQEALWGARRGRLRKQFYQLQGYWTRKAKEKGIFSEQDLARRGRLSCRRPACRALAVLRPA